MIGLATLLFYNTAGSYKTTYRDNNPLVCMAVVLAWFMPVLNYWGHWYDYLSFGLYTGKTNAYTIVIGEKEIHKLDKSIWQYFEKNGLKGARIIDVHKWAIQELNVPVYPESEVFRKLAKSFYKFGIKENELFFLVIKPPLKDMKFKKYTCSEIK